MFGCERDVLYLYEGRRLWCSREADCGSSSALFAIRSFVFCKKTKGPKRRQK